MIEIKRVLGGLTLEALNEAGRLSPVVYVFFDRPGLEAALAEVLAKPEPGEIAVVADFDPASAVCKRFGVVSREAMLAFSLNCPASSGSSPKEYVTAIEYARKWRKKNANAEERGWPAAHGEHRQ